MRYLEKTPSEALVVCGEGGPELDRILKALPAENLQWIGRKGRGEGADDDEEPAGFFSSTETSPSLRRSALEIQLVCKRL
jgi:hypothetical protein